MKMLDTTRYRPSTEHAWLEAAATLEGELIMHCDPDLASRPERDLEIRAYYRGEQRSVLLHDVIYLRADQKYVSVHHLHGVLLVDRSLRAFEREFPDLLLRIHRNTLVARSCLRGLHKHADGAMRAVLSGCSEHLIVSRRHVRAVLGQLAAPHSNLRFSKPI